MEAVRTTAKGATIIAVIKDGSPADQFSFTSLFILPAVKVINFIGSTIGCTGTSETPLKAAAAVILLFVAAVFEGATQVPFTAGNIVVLTTSIELLMPVLKY